ncbi:complement factor H-related protein 2-like isoform X2 [Struthio camelus]|uniref:complement factor H-related protein 2-like isoform X2 n=1 Tax=Struthio camelus TaxID=8801 RepID=UPI003603F371
MALVSLTTVFLLWMCCTTPKASARTACEDPPVIDFGEIASGNKSGYEENDRVQYMCNPGYTLSGSEWVTCHEKIWTPGPPQCLAPCTITKQQLEARKLLLSHGRRHTFLIQSGQKLEFVCITGYKLTSSSVRKCVNGHMTFPSCISDVSCGAPPEIPRASIASSEQERYLPGARVQYECESNFQIMGVNYVTCTNGQWSQAPTCRDMTCEPPPEIAGGKVQGVKKSRYLPEERAQYRCWQGFQMTGDSTVACQNGTWTQLPTCRGRGEKCGPPPAIENGDLLSFPLQEYAPGSTVEYKCPSLYVLEGSRYITCAEGQWTNPPVCLVACTASEEDMNRNNIELKWVTRNKLYLKSGDFVEFECKIGYVKDPASSPFRAQCVEGTLEYPYCKPGRLLG